MNLIKKYQPSESCSCSICVDFCKRPGWWIVEEARLAIKSGYASRMMLEISPEKKFGVLSPAFKGNEGNFSYKLFSNSGCTFLNDNLCELYSTGLQPLECRFCHHSRMGLGKKCHLDIENDWYSINGMKLVNEWGNLIGLWDKFGIHSIEDILSK